MIALHDGVNLEYKVSLILRPHDGRNVKVYSNIIYEFELVKLKKNDLPILYKFNGEEF
jgi:hypothetical protein